MPPRLFDTHAHLDDEQFDEIREDMLARARETGVSDVLAVGTTLASSRKCLELAACNGVHAAVGIQPNYCHEAESGDWDGIVELARGGEAVAIGETGLDGYWDWCPMDLQRDYFDRHLRLSQELDLPFIVHLRDSAEPIAEMLAEARRRGPLRGVMHSYTGDAELARQCLDLGLHISFAGMLTFKKSHELREVAASVPAERLLIETDAPYLSPEPFRGKPPNEPARVVHTAQCLAEVRGIEFAELAELTWSNAYELFLADR